ncbi:MAG: DMT family transporter [Candidatus Promineifilaceae bacterium]|jgi:drug/metabolite transporter (DMT)-like permease
MDESSRQVDLAPWLGVTLLAQTAWGAYPVLARYLQTVSDLPSMSILALGNLIALVVVGLVFLPRIRPADLMTPRLLLFAALVVARGISNFLAARYTLAIYVQLITLLTPFIVALLSMLIWQERLPRFTGRALFLGLFGVLLIIGIDLFEKQGMPTTDRTDWLGIALAAGSSLMLALYMIAVRRLTFFGVRGQALLLTQLLVLSMASFALSYALGESWQQWRHITLVDWFVFALLTFGVLIGANLSQIGAIRHLGAALVSSTMPWRLVSALAVSALLLNEHLSSFWQFVGVALVMGTISWYLWEQRR